MSAYTTPVTTHGLGALRPAGDATAVDLVMIELGNNVASQLQNLLKLGGDPRRRAARRRLAALADLVGGPSGSEFPSLTRLQQLELLEETRLTHLSWALDRHDYLRDRRLEGFYDDEGAFVPSAALRSMAAHRAMLSANLGERLVDIGEHETVYSAYVDQGWARISFGSSHVRVRPERGSDDEYDGWLAKMPEPLYRVGSLYGWTARGLVELFERFEAYWNLASTCEETALGGHVGMFIRIDPIERDVVFELGHRTFQLDLSDDEYIVRHGPVALERSEAERVLNTLADSGGAAELIELLREAFDQAAPR